MVKFPFSSVKVASLKSAAFSFTVLLLKEIEAYGTALFCASTILPEICCFSCAKAIAAAERTRVRPSVFLVIKFRISV